MSLSRFRAQPRKGHLDRAKRIVGYLLFLPDGAIRFRIGEPDFSSLKDQEYDWTRTVYSGACEQIPHDIPKPLKWKQRSRLGVYLGPSPNHARSVALVLNPRTGHVSPQFHVKFDDFFETVQSKDTDLDAPPNGSI